MNRVTGLLFSIALGVLFGSFVLPMLGDWTQPAAASPRPVSAAEGFDADEQRNVTVFRETAPSVVYIVTKQTINGYFATQEAAGEGSGFLWDEAGHVVTNFHVINGANSLAVTLHDRSQYDAKVIGGSPENDIAVLKIDAPVEKLRAIKIGSSSDLQVGQKVFAIGNPFGFDYTMTTGIVSAIGRSIVGIAGNKIDEVIQTDAAINPGNSGGPLLDSSGRLIGMNTSIFAPGAKQSSGIGFAVPVDIINRVVPDIVAYGQVRRPQLGVGLVDSEQNGRIATLLYQIRKEGVMVQSVTPGAGAERAGLVGFRQVGNRTLLGDVITEIDGEPVRTRWDLFKILQNKQAGDTVKVKYLRFSARDYEEREAEIKLSMPPT
jgi:S1-C subfamily serine protease